MSIPMQITSTIKYTEILERWIRLVKIHTVFSTEMQAFVQKEAYKSMFKISTHLLYGSIKWYPGMCSIFLFYYYYCSLHAYI